MISRGFLFLSASLSLFGGRYPINLFSPELIGMGKSTGLDALRTHSSPFAIDASTRAICSSIDGNSILLVIQQPQDVSISIGYMEYSEFSSSLPYRVATPAVEEEMVITNK